SGKRDEHRQRGLWLLNGLIIDKPLDGDHVSLIEDLVDEAADKEFIVLVIDTELGQTTVTEELQHLQFITSTPPFGHLIPTDPDDVDPLGRHSLASWRYAHQMTGVRPAPSADAHDDVSFTELFVDVVVKVRKSFEERLKD